MSVCIHCLVMQLAQTFAALKYIEVLVKSVAKLDVFEPYKKTGHVWTTIILIHLH